MGVKGIVMSEKRNITRDDIYLKARLLSEGARINVRKPPETPVDFMAGIVFDGCEIVSSLRPNRYSRLEAVVEGGRVTISDMGEVLGTATYEERPEWFDIPLSNGQPARSGVMGMSSDVIAIIQNHVCYNQASGQGCKYCSAFIPSENRGSPGRQKEFLRDYASLQAEAIEIALDHGWRGMISCSGGVLPPGSRGDLTERLEIVLEPLHARVDAEVLSQMHLMANCYPPEDLSEMYKWRDLGIKATDIDLEAMDPAYFAALCPGKAEAHPHEYWKEAMFAATEVFGPGRGSCTSVVMGLEPMDALVEGFEELISKGVLTTPLSFQPSPRSAYAQFNPPAATWFVEATEKMADSYLRHEDKLDAPVFEDERPGYTRTGRSYFIMLLNDELWRRGQEMGKLPPGLPKQGT